MNARKLCPAMARRFAAGGLCWLALAAVDLVCTPAQAGTAGILDPATFTTPDGQQIFENICQGCHMHGGQGAVGAGHFPALAKNRALASRQYMAVTILMGRRNMPAFGAKHAIGFNGPAVTLNTRQIAAVINYVRSHFGNRYTDSITTAEVETLDQSVN